MEASASFSPQKPLDESEPAKGRRRSKRESKWKKLDIPIEMEGSSYRERRQRRDRNARSARRRQRGSEEAFDFGFGFNMSPVDPESPEGYAYYLQCAVAHLDYLFSAAYLSGDYFLRSSLDCTGAVPVAFVCNSYRIGMGLDYDDLLDAIEAYSECLELDREVEAIRLVDNAEEYLLPNADGTSGCQVLPASVERLSSAT
uniref:HTH La-type RNA-binding domain-containing protein n=1 Tax=Pinguiococcus pyrenoidosus TaxID=172671 RepID=A0A7R9UBL5_9STRA|mmetsp:Transcript_2819/g.11516  ORF Transcript_2819/g.11516 Transcript_2819/m.11516 type:complete len:200 (+) Transcript_2819:123-722(+)